VNEDFLLQRLRSTPEKAARSKLSKLRDHKRDEAAEVRRIKREEALEKRQIRRKRQEFIRRHWQELQSNLILLHRITSELTRLGVDRKRMERDTSYDLWLLHAHSYGQTVTPFSFFGYDVGNCDSPVSPQAKRNF
jgi:hypothetical protein